MAERRQITGESTGHCRSTAPSTELQIQRVLFQVAGDPDILLVPDLEAGNILAKQLSFLAMRTVQGWSSARSGSDSHQSRRSVRSRSELRSVEIWWLMPGEKSCREDNG
jgi:hypothetical protein